MGDLWFMIWQQAPSSSIWFLMGDFWFLIGDDVMMTKIGCHIFINHKSDVINQKSLIARAWSVCQGAAGDRYRFRIYDLDWRFRLAICDFAANAKFNHLPKMFFSILTHIRESLICLSANKVSGLSASNASGLSASASERSVSERQRAVSTDKLALVPN